MTSSELGAQGPVRVGSTTAEVRVRRGVGAAPGLLGLGSGAAAYAGTPLPGLTVYVDPALALIPVTLTGPAGVSGAGELDIPVGVSPGLGGSSFFHQVFLLDLTAPFFLTHTNGLEIHYGL